MKNMIFLSMISLLCLGNSKLVYAQDSMSYRLKLSISGIDWPQNSNLPYTYPSMTQSLELGNDFYELGYWGIDKLGNIIVRPGHETNPAGRGRKILNNSVKYLLSLGFVWYGSELPIPLGVWTHEEFHRSVLGVNQVASINGNWIGNRWDGTVYGVRDSELANLKQNNLPSLLYAYVAGVQAENLITQTNFIKDFYDHRTIYKNALYLYNAYYVWNYFRFATGPNSDSVKQLAPPHENPDPRERDFAGADLTAWAYDMFNPNEPFTDRDDFPNGTGVNRRIGFSDLTPEAQDFLKKQMKLSLINFINPAIFFINCIRLSPAFSFNFMGQYSPTPFGNDVSLILPFTHSENHFMLGLHRYTNQYKTFGGLEVGIMDTPLLPGAKWHISGILHSWIQPASQSFFDQNGKLGGTLDVGLRYQLTDAFSLNGNLSAKSRGWVLGNPYLDQNISFRVGVNIDLRESMHHKR